MMKTVIIDNYDSFTYNLSQLLREAGSEVTVLRNDKFELKDLASFDRILLSPGPGIPCEAGLLLDVIREYAPIKPMLGVCLGHQAIGEVFGAHLENLPNVCHGIESTIKITAEDTLFKNLSHNLTVGRYHSWVISREQFPDSLEITALSNDGSIMALRHRHYHVHGIQFHPESILTPMGYVIIQNWLDEKHPVSLY